MCYDKNRLLNFKALACYFFVNMNNKNNNLIDKFYKDIMPMVTGFGAAVVIIGAMFKLLNLSGASVMLAVGLLTEAALFILGAFEPKHKEFDWFEVYPELAEDEGNVPVAKNLQNRLSPRGSSNHDDVSLSSKLDEIFSKANIDASLINRLGDGMEKMATYAGNMASLPDTAQASEKYCSSLLKASHTIEGMSTAHDKIMSALNSISDIASGGDQYKNKINSIVESLNVVELNYKKEAEHVEKRLESISAAYNSMGKSIADLATIGGEANRFKEELTQLSEKFESLNKIYGNMLNVFKV